MIERIKKPQDGESWGFVHSNGLGAGFVFFGSGFGERYFSVRFIHLEGARGEPCLHLPEDTVDDRGLVGVHEGDSLHGLDTAVVRIVVHLHGEIVRGL